jgi:ketosteroid isomerase-like protein
MTPAQVATRFYEAMSKRDWKGMGDLYQEGGTYTFSDPLFPRLNLQDTRSMWHMLMSRAKDFSLTFQVTSASPDSVWVEWTARYVFSRTGRSVTNHVKTQMKISNGKIIQQDDVFDLRDFSKQALGTVGQLLGGTGLFRAFMQRQVAQQLRGFISHQAKKQSI